MAIDPTNDPTKPITRELLDEAVREAELVVTILSKAEEEIRKQPHMNVVADKVKELMEELRDEIEHCKKLSPGLL